MAQHDFNIANQIGSEFRADLNNALTAIATTSSGSSEPSTTFAHQLWVDTGNNLLKIRNAANNAWITIGVSITTSNTFTGDITGNVVGNITGNVVGDVTGDLTGNADTATTLATARTIQLSGDVVGSTSFDGSGNVTITTTISSDSTVLGTDTTGDYVESISGGTGVTITGGTGEGSTPSVAIGQAVATTDNVTFNLVTATDEFVGDIDGAVRFSAKAGEALTKGDLIYVSGVSGDVPVVSKAKADDVSKMPVFGLAVTDANNNAGLQIATFGTLDGLDTSGVSEGQILYASTTAGAYTTTKPTGESSLIQNIGKVIRSHAAAGSIKIGGAGRSNDVPNLNDGNIFIGNGSNQSSTATLNTALVPESTNLYYTDARFDTRLATKDTDDLTEGTSSLYFTNERVDDRVNSLLTAGSNVTLTYDDSANTLTIAATEDDLSNNSTSDLAEGTNLYYTDARSRAAISAGGDLSYNSTTGVMSFTERTDAEVRGLVSASGDLSYNSSTGVFSFTERTDAEVRGLVSASGDLSYNSSTGVFSFTERTDAEVRGLVSASGDLSYNSSTGVFSFTQRTDAQVQALITGGTGVTVSSGEVAIGQAVGTTDDVTFNDVTVSGDLVVSGTTTTINTETINLADNQIVLNSNFTGSSPAENGGIEIERGTQTNKTLIWNETDDKWTVGSETFVAATFEGALSGNATTATTLETARTISGVSFDGSANITLDTDNIGEGSTNQYFTNARSRSSISVGSEGTASGDGAVAYNSSTGVFTYTPPILSGLSGDTDSVSEGSTNLYHTTERVQDVVGGQLVTNGSHTGISFTYDDGTDGAIDATVSLSSFDTDSLSEGSTNLYHTTERVQDIVGGMVTGNTETGITVTYQDADGTLDFEVGTLNQDTTGNAATATALETARTINGTSFDGTTNISFDSDSVSEGSTNLYFSDERVDDRVNNLLTAGTGITLTYNDTANTLEIAGSAQYGDSDVESYLDGGTSTPTFSSANITNTSTDDSLLITTTEDSSTAAPVITLKRNSSSPADGDYLGQLKFKGENDADQEVIYAKVTGKISDASDTTEDGLLEFTLKKAGSNNIGMRLTSSDLKLINGTGLEVAGLTYPTSDGTDGQVLTTNGAGTLSFNTVSTYTDSDVETYLDGGTSTPTFASATISGDLTVNTSTLKVDSTNNAVLVGKTSGTSGNTIETNGRISAAAGSNSQPTFNCEGDTNTGINLPESDRIQFITGGSERMRIDSSGNVIVGGTTASSTVLDGTGAAGCLYIGNSSELYPVLALESSQRAYLLYQDNSGRLQIYDSTSNDTRFSLSTAGAIGIGQTPDSTHKLSLKADATITRCLNMQTVNAGSCAITQNVSGTGAYNAFLFLLEGGNSQKGSIAVGAGGTAFNTTSDYRLKENIVTDWDATTRLKQLRPSRFNFIGESDTTVDGFLAHEVSDIVPEAVTGEKDATETLSNVVLDSDSNVIAVNIEEDDWTTGKTGDEPLYPSDSTWEASHTRPVYQGIDQAKLVPLLVKTIQELEARITTLENA